VKLAQIFMIEGRAPGRRAQVVQIDSTYLELGGGKYLVAASYDTGRSLIPGVQYSWKSSDPSVATVDSQGLVRGIKVGQTVMTATASGVVSNPETVTVIETGGNGGPIGDKIKVTVFDATTDDPIEGAMVGIGGTDSSGAYAIKNLTPTDVAGVATIIDSGMAGQPQDVHILADGYATTSFYQVNNDDLVLTLNPFTPTVGRMVGTVSGITSDFGIVNASGSLTPVETRSRYFFPDFSAKSLNGLPAPSTETNVNAASAPSPTLTASPHFMGASLIGFNCAGQPSLVHLGFAFGVGPTDPLFPVTQNFTLVDNASAISTIQATVNLPASPSISGFTPSNLREVQAYADFGDEGAVQVGMDVTTYCSIYGLWSDDPRLNNPRIFSLSYTPAEGTSSYWIQATTDTSSKVVQEQKKGLSLRLQRWTDPPPATLDLTLMDVPQQVSPPDSITETFSPPYTLGWNNTTGVSVPYFQVFLSDANPPGNNRGGYFWKVTVPGTMTSVTIPQVPPGAPINSGYIIPGNLVNWRVTASDFEPSSTSSFDYNLLRGGQLTGSSSTPQHLFRP
jgi:hypothetical protein